MRTNSPGDAGVRDFLDQLAEAVARSVVSELRRSALRVEAGVSSAEQAGALLEDLHGESSDRNSHEAETV